MEKRMEKLEDNLTYINKGRSITSLLIVLGGTLNNLYANADLNSLTTPGNYMAGFAVGPTVTNKPSGCADAFVVDVEIGYAQGKATQTLKDWNGLVFYRFQNSGGWTNWREF